MVSPSLSASESAHTGLNGLGSIFRERPSGIVSDNPTVYNLIETLVDAFSHVRSLSELHQTAIRLARSETGGDVSVVAFEKDDTFNWLASDPRGWNDVEYLTSPASLPRIVATEGKYCIIDDRSDLRSTTETSSGKTPSGVEYPSVMIVPFYRNGYILSGSKRKADFSQDDLDRLRVIGALSSLLHHRLENSSYSDENADRLNEAAAFLSHDAKNLLSVINGRVELAKDTPSDTDFDLIQQHIDRLDELITATATLLKSGSQISETKPTSLKDAARTAWESVNAPDALFNFESGATIVADQSRLCQLFTNLFRNGVEHVGPGVELRVGLLEGKRGFYVEDDGPGIDPEERDSVFEPGFSTSPDHTGVGLNIVKWIADAHGWEISVTESSVGGARFEFGSVTFVED